MTTTLSDFIDFLFYIIYLAIAQPLLALLSTFNDEKANHDSSEDGNGDDSSNDSNISGDRGPPGSGGDGERGGGDTVPVSVPASSPSASSGSLFESSSEATGSGSGGSGGEPGDTATARDHVIDLTGAGASSDSLSECSSDLSNGSNISNRDHVIDLTGTGASESSSSSISLISDIGFPAISNEFPDNWHMNFTEDARIKPESLLGKHVAKYFEQYKKIYHGVVDKVIADGCFPLWRILYDDGDKEDLDMSGLKKCLLFYEDLHKTSTKYGNKNKSSRRSS